METARVLFEPLSVFPSCLSSGKEMFQVKRGGESRGGGESWVGVSTFVPREGNKGGGCGGGGSFSANHLAILNQGCVLSVSANREKSS